MYIYIIIDYNPNSLILYKCMKRGRERLERGVCGDKEDRSMRISRRRPRSGCVAKSEGQGGQRGGEDSCNSEKCFSVYHCDEVETFVCDFCDAFSVIFGIFCFLFFFFP